MDGLSPCLCSRTPTDFTGCLPPICSICFCSPIKLYYFNNLTENHTHIMSCKQRRGGKKKSHVNLEMFLGFPVYSWKCFSDYVTVPSKLNAVNMGKELGAIGIFIFALIS